jgi:hypothetical protein
MNRFKTINEFIETKEIFSFTETVEIKHIYEGKRLIDVFSSINESKEEFNLLTEKEKYIVDNLIWESVLEYVVTDDVEIVTEAFWKSVVKGVKDLSDKGLSYAKKIISNIGNLIKDIGEYIKKFFAAVKTQVIDKAIKKASASVQAKLKDRTVTIKEGMKDDVANLAATVAFLVDPKKSVGANVDKNTGQAITLGNQAVGAEEEETEKLLKRVEGELEGGDEKDEKKPNENHIYRNAIANAINEMRATESFDFNEFVQLAEEYSEFVKLEESDDAGAELEKEVGEKKKGFLAKIKESASIGTIISFITSGVVKLFEMITEWVLKKGLGKVSQLCKTAGGPGAFEFAAIGALAAVVVGIILEFALGEIGKLTGSHMIEEVAHALHATSPLYLLGHVAEHMVPGAATFAKAATILWVTYANVEHLFHASHKEGEHH